jgi:hypothetical protein
MAFDSVMPLLYLNYGPPHHQSAGLCFGIKGKRRGKATPFSFFAATPNGKPLFPE